MEQSAGLPALLPYRFALSPPGPSPQEAAKPHHMALKDTRKTHVELEMGICQNSDKVISLEVCADSIRGTKEKNLKVKEQFGCLLKLLQEKLVV